MNIGRDGIEHLTRADEGRGWDRIGISWSGRFEPRWGWADDVLYRGLVRRRALGLGWCGLYWLRMREQRP